ncbi:outer membrane protein assembly factor BamB family protein [Streptacidiphilus fuscans]|uniref:PQQ-binding-like beta-propeller repeat protein n=1 Tax=Streptacidiphilus fuscans TaxID=2789292 RepID=A0A931FBT8_9ACTN|nr:PQQ-binding-like beta-propeller repeat protein [Streptacidiphilus fuscans]MBF9069017.1 PQQ-binding-like beta-propeller repeat protein [Streptacidiphilus fuscans]
MTSGRGIRSGTVATVLAVAAALLSTPLAHAGSQPSGKDIRLNAAALTKLSQRYENRTDGTAGQVAAEEGSSSAAPALPSATPGTKPLLGTHTADTAGASGTSGTGPGFQQTGQWETARGFAETTTLPGTHDWVDVFSGGTVGRYNSHGDQIWNRPATSLMKDWQVTAENWYQPYPYTPNLYVGYNPYEMSTTGQHPYATGDFSHDGVDDVAVASAVGDQPARPFTSPGSQLNYGTFLTVLDGRTGKTLWSKLVPGYVGTMLVQDGKLIVAESTGPQWNVDPVAEQGDSRSNLTAYSFSPQRGGTLAATTDWTYSTQAPWANWGDVEPAGHGEIAATWSDTPLGLGNPRPADGNVLLIDTGDGSVAMHAKTPGYPRMVAQDPTSDRVLVVEQNDPFDAVRWELTAFDPRTGARSVIAERDGTVPEAFAVNPHAHSGQATYAVAELGINADLSDGQSTVSGWDARGNTLWSYTTASTVSGPNAPTMALAYPTDGRGEVVASVSDPNNPSASLPDGPEHTQLIGFDPRDGHVDWQNQGALSGDTLTPYQNGLLTVGYDDTAYTVDPHSGRSDAMPLAGDPHAAATVGTGDRQELITGGQSRGVFGLDARTLKSPTPAVLWHATVDASVHAVKALPGGRQVVVGTDHGFSVLDARTGAVLHTVRTGGFVASLTVTGDSHGGTEIVVPGSSLTAYRPDGSVLWTFQPAGTAGKSLVFSSVTTDDSGHLLLEYGGTMSSALYTAASDPAPTAVSLDEATGTPVWTETTNDPGAAAIVPTNPALADPNVPGGHGHGVAFAFNGTFSNSAHLVQILDSRTGAVIRTNETVGSNTFLAFAASKADGLAEMRTFDMTDYPADGSAPYDVPTFLGFHSGTFATTPSGATAFIGAYTSLFSYNTPFPQGQDSLRESATAFALAASQVQPADLNDGNGSDVLGLSIDWRALDISLQAIGGDTFEPDYYPHGVTTFKFTDNMPSGIPLPPSTTAAASGTAGSSSLTTQAQQKLLFPAPTQASTSGVTGQTSATPLANQGMPVGTAALPIEIKSSTPTATPLSSPADNATEITRGYTPQQIQTRLGLKGDGTGQTIAIVDAYDYPTAEADLNHFSAHFNLPQTCDSASSGTDCFNFRVSYADGSRPAGNTGWNEEEALDIEWAHSVAPHATIVLVEANDPSMAALERADDAAAALHPAAVSNSWGSSEFSEESFYDGHCKLADSVCVQSTGDNGYPSGYSATNPYVLAIGGTSLQLDANGNTLGETAWRSTGGGLSFFEPRPAYQNGVQPSPYRATPDVSMVADPNTGVPVYLTLQLGGTNRSLWMEVGGTSLAAPIWGAIITDTDQLRAAAGKPHLASAGPDGDTAHADVYALGSGYLRDITSGSNGLCGAECTAGPGYDTVTGLGSPTAGVDAALAAMK